MTPPPGVPGTAPREVADAPEGTVTVSVVGSTGSIGTQTLDVVARDPERYRVVALGAQRSVDTLVEQARALHPEVVAVGFAGLSVTLAALEAGRRLALANKESIIAGAPVVAAVRGTPGAELLPVDSEHCAVHQCLRSGRPADVARLLLTASGGPFRGRKADELADVGVDEALDHPTWSMGPKITVDSSTLMNKGLEVIEAHELFGVPYDAIDVVVHPQSVVHSMVEFVDGAVVAQLSLPDMRLPIGYALAYPARLAAPFGAIDWAELSVLEFEPPDRATFPCLDLAYRAGRTGDLAPAWLNAANEVAVEAFLAGRIRWAAIADVVAATLDRYDAGSPGDGRTVEDVLDADATARRLAAAMVGERSSS